MKDKKWIIVAPVLVVALGMTGFITGENYSVYNALLSSLKFLKVDFEPLPPNILLELARWIGIIFFAGVIYSILEKIVENGKLFWKVKKKDTVAIHGDSPYATLLFKALGKQAVRTKNSLSLKAPIQVIVNTNDNDTLSFYQEKTTELNSVSEVHLCFNRMHKLEINNENTFVTNTTEINAIDFWQKNWLSSPETIAIVGEGELAEEVLYWGLLTNIFDIVNNNRYILFGSHDEYQATHPDIVKMLQDYGGDKLEFITKPWYERMDLLKEADRIIICDDTLSSIDTAFKIFDHDFDAKIFVYAENGDVTDIVESQELSWFGAINTQNIKSLFLMDSIHKGGKMCHGAYMIGTEKESGSLNKTDVEAFIKTEAFKQSWSALNTFTRSSNFAAAIHDVEKKNLLAKVGININGLSVKENSTAYDALSLGDRNRLQEIEHIRWCRYHFLNNWKPMISDETSSERIDKAKKQHADLIPYKDLSPGGKDKDAYFYKTLCLRMN